VDYEYIRYLKDHNPSVRLLRLENAPLIVSFLYQHFKSDNNIVLSGAELTTRLSDYLHNLRENYGDDIYPDTAKNYLERWATEGFLRKYYMPDSDEPMFELTPATEKAMEWIRDLDKKEFVGTESRLLKIFEILKEIVYKSSDDPQKRMAELERQRQEIEKEIEKIKAGEIEKFSETQIKERFYDVYDTARKLISDFRQIEYNFREIDRSLREKQLNSNIKKGKLLEDIFRSHDLLWQTDQGNSFRAFWEFLMSQSKQEELDDLIESVNRLPAVRDIKNDDFIDRIKVSMIEAGDKVNKTIHHLVEQLRKYLDDKTLLENKRIIEVIRGIKASALEIKDNPPADKDFITVGDKPDIKLIMERPLFSPAKSVEIRGAELEEGNADSVDASVLYRQLYIDYDSLKNNIRELLKFKTQATLKQIIDVYPIEKGLTEILAYYDIASKDSKSFINNETTEAITIVNRETGRYFEIQAPQVIFCR
jgi:hypothetical protein